MARQTVSIPRGSASREKIRQQLSKSDANFVELYAADAGGLPEYEAPADTAVSISAYGTDDSGSVAITLIGNDGDAGGAIELRSGSSNEEGVQGGWISLIAGSGGEGEGGGFINILAGNGAPSEEGFGGTITIEAGDSGGGGGANEGGNIELNAGDGVSGNNSGGNIRFSVGAKAGSGTLGHMIVMGGLESFADDAAAAAGGVPVNGLYRTASAVKIRVA
jgi:hypothetical protein